MYPEGEIKEYKDWEGVEASQGIKDNEDGVNEADESWPSGIKEENSMNGELTSSNPAYLNKKGNM